ncbi:MAG: hypothetical protein QM647_06300 [Asticcacaulis sp.]|uniref:hypothetical protein n=1 Tax=Asticcacaulis sp. TaxID=1872648 RepID=UPI0039E50AFB
MKDRNFNWLIAEPAPYGLSPQSLQDYNYNTFSCRTGNIYTTALLLQWTRWALGISDVPTEVWSDGQNYFDPFRPAIEPGGFLSCEEMIRSRMETLGAFRKCIETSRIRAKTPGGNRRALSEYISGLELLNAERYLPMGAAVIPQPHETIVDGCKTEARFSVGSRRLSVGSFIDDELHPESDLSHMNEAFGELWLRQFLTQLAMA